MFDLKKARESRNLSQEDIAKRVGVTRGTVSKWEKGDIANMKRDKIASLANILNINPLEILDMPSSHNESSLTKPNFNTYNYFDAGLSAGVLLDVDPFTENDVQQIALSDELMGPYAGDKDLFVTHINGESMNHVLPNGSMVAIKEYSSIHNLKDGDIVVFQDGGEMSVKRFYNDPSTQIITFMPDSTDSSYRPINYRYEDINGLRIIGKVVVYSVVLC